MKTCIEIDIKIDDIVKDFVSSGSDEQALLFNSIGKAFKECDFNSELQFCYIVDNIDKDGKNFIFALANFLKARGMTNSPKLDVMISAYD